MTSRIPLSLAVAVAVLAGGCISDAPPSTHNLTSDSEAPEPPELVEVELYSFEDIIVGVSPPHPQEDGPLVEPLPTILVEAFEVPEEARRLAVYAIIHEGTGYGRIEIYGPDGDLFAASDHEACAGVPLTFSACLVIGSADEGGEIMYGSYEVVYRAAGVLGAVVDVSASVPAGSSSGG